MPSFVTKKDGTRVAFSMKKITHAVHSCGLEAGFSEEESMELAQKISEAVDQAFLGQEEVASKEIKSVVLAELEVVAPVICDLWKKYEEGKQII